MVKAMDGLQAACHSDRDIELGLRTLRSCDFYYFDLVKVAHNRGFRSIARVARRLMREEVQKTMTPDKGAPDGNDK